MPVSFDDSVRAIISTGFENALTEERKESLRYIGKAWDFFYGYQDKYIKQYRGESDDDYKDKDKMTFNYVRSIVDEYINGVFAKPVGIKFADTAQQKTWQSIAEPQTFFKIFPFFTKVQKIAEISNMCVVMIRYDQKRKQVIFEDIRGEYVTFLPDPENPKEIGAVIISYLFDTGIGNPQERYLKRVEVWNEKRWEIWLHNPSTREEKKVKSGDNPYGFIPAVRFVPEEDDNTFYGISSIDDIVTVNEVYNNLWTSLVRTCVMQSFSVLVIKTDGELKLTVAPTRFLKFDNTEEADAKYITPDPKIEAVEKVLLDLKSELQDFSKVPSEVLQASKSKFPSSGYALRIKRIPIEEVWQKRRMSYGPALRDLLKKTIIVDAINNNDTPPEYNKIDVELMFAETIPPYSPQEQAVMDQNDIMYNLATPVDLMIRKNPHMSREEALKAIEANKAENKKLGVVMNPDEVPPDPANQGKNNLMELINRKQKRAAEIPEAPISESE